MVVVALIVQALELDHLQQEIDTELTYVMQNMHTLSKQNDHKIQAYTGIDQ